MFNTTYQPQSSLPVSAQQVVVQTFPTVPNQIPFVPNVQCDPNTQQFVPMVTGLYMKCLQDNAARGPSRIFALNMNGQNNWQNQVFFEALQGLMEYMEFLMVTQRMQPQFAAQQAVESYCKLMSAMYITQYPELQAGLTQQAGAEVQNVMAAFGMLDQNIKAYLAQKQQGAQLQNQLFNQQPQFNQFGHAVQPQQGQQWNSMRPTTPHHLAVASSPAPVHAPAVNPNLPSGRGGLAPRRGGGTGIVQEFGDNALGQPVIETKPGYARAYVPTPIEGKVAVNIPIGQTHAAPPTYVQPPEPEYTHITDTGIGVIQANPDRPYDAVTMDNGVEVRPALSSGWVRDFDPAKPYSELYDPTTHVKFHVRDATGKVHESVLEMKEDMQYINHELNKRRNTTTPLAADAARTEPHWASVERMAKLPAASTEDLDPETRITLSKSPMVLPEMLQAHSFAESEILFRAHMAQRGMDILPQVPAEYYYDNVTPVFTGQDCLPLVQELASATSLVRLAEKLREQFDKDENKAYWYALNSKLTAHFNEVLEVNMQLVGWRVDSFCDDFVPMLDMLVEDYSETLVDKLEGAARKIITGTVDALFGETLKEYFAKLSNGDNEKTRELRGSTLVLSERVSVTTLNWRLSDFVGDITATPVMVKESAMPVFYNALKALVKRTGGYRHRYLLTLDRQVVEVHEGYLGTDVYLIRTVTPK